MKIGLLGTGHIGKKNARTRAAAGHDVKVANSRGADTIPADVLETGARAVTQSEALTDIGVAILSVPPTAFEALRELVSTLPEYGVLIDTSNYYPGRDGAIAAIEAGQIEAERVREQLGRPMVKAWNAIGSDSFSRKGRKAGEPGRIAIPVAGERHRDQEIAIKLVDDSGFDGFDAGTLETAWRQQPGAPAYCTDLTLEEMGP